MNGCSLASLLDLIDDPAHDPTVLLRNMMASPHKQIAQVGRGMLSTADRERASIISTARRLLRLYRDPVVARNTDISDFAIDDLMNADRPVTLYLETRGEDELRLRPLIRLFLTLAIGQLISKPPALVNGLEVIPHKHRMLLAIDELASLGAMEPLELALSKSAGAGITGPAAGSGPSSRSSNPMAHTRRSLRTARSPRPMRRTTRRPPSGCPRRAANPPTWWRRSARASATANGRRTGAIVRSPRALMTPDEVRRLKPPVKDAAGKITSPGDLLVFQGGQVIKGTQSLAFRDPEFNRRMGLAVPATQKILP